MTFDKTRDKITIVAADKTRQRLPKRKSKKLEKSLKKLLTNKKLSDKITKSLASDNKTKYLDK